MVSLHRYHFLKIARGKFELNIFPLIAAIYWSHLRYLRILNLSIVIYDIFYLTLSLLFFICVLYDKLFHVKKRHHLLFGMQQLLYHHRGKYVGFKWITILCFAEVPFRIFRWAKIMVELVFCRGCAVCFVLKKALSVKALWSLVC